MDIRYPAPDRWGEMHIAGDRNRRNPLDGPASYREPFTTRVRRCVAVVAVGWVVFAAILFLAR